MKKLPKIYQNKIDKVINNNKKIDYVKKDSNKKNIISDRMSSSEINSIIDGIFNEDGYSFNIPVIIQTNTKRYETSLITRTNGYILTFDHGKIKVEDIYFIQRKNS